MAFDESELTPGVDIDNINLAGDRGDSLPDDKPVDRGDNAELEDDEKEVLKDLGKKDEKAEDESEDEESEDEKDDDQPRDDKGRFKEKGEARIPKSRFDEAVNKEREAREAAERRAAELERRLQESTVTKESEEQVKAREELESKIETLEKKYGDLLIDGDTEGAAKVMREIRQAERAIARAEADAAAEVKTAKVLEAERVEATVARLQADFPMLNEDSEEYNPKVVRYVLSEQRRYMAEEGLTASRALERAGKEAMELFTPQKSADEAEDKETLAKAKLAEDRKAKQVEKNLDTQKRQPPSMKSSGTDSDKFGEKGLPDPTKMSYEEFEALPSATKAKLRGDLL